MAGLSTATRSFWRGAEPVAIEVNGRSGALLHRDGVPSTILTMTASKEVVHKVMWVWNPRKIAAFLDSRSRFTTAPDPVADGG
ncbi:hypothetical protein GCM10022207_45400 [Streptomyces lannensis]|uniref:Uncharacterized protein n=1 Tax=Streptomyces lannensis TaxID=766498 RepID=A0ABP7KE41_9ACTN